MIFSLHLINDIIISICGNCFFYDKNKIQIKDITINLLGNKNIFLQYEIDIDNWLPIKFYMFISKTKNKNFMLIDNISGILENSYNGFYSSTMLENYNNVFKTLNMALKHLIFTKCDLYDVVSNKNQVDTCYE